MKNSTLTRFAGCLALSAVVGATLTQMTACKKEEPPPPPPRRAPPPPPPPPEPVDLARLMDSLDGIDARVQFPQEQAPTDEGLAENVLLFTSALVSKDAEALRPMMSSAGRDVLSQVEQNWWSTDIDAARVVMLTMGGGGQPRDSTGGLSSEVAQLLDEMNQIALDAIPDDLRSQIPSEQFAQLTGGFDTALFAGMTDNMVHIAMGAAKPMVERMANGDFSQIARNLGMPEGIELPAETQEQMSQLQPVFDAMLEQMDKVIAAVDSAQDNIETSDSSATLVTALHDATGSYVLMWDAQRFDDGWFFTPQAATPEMRQSVRDWDGGGLNDYRVELVAAPIIPDIPDTDDDSPNQDNDDSGGGSHSTGG